MMDFNFNFVSSFFFNCVSVIIDTFLCIPVERLISEAMVFLSWISNDLVRLTFIFPDEFKHTIENDR